jgi:hypothetical protein
MIDLDKMNEFIDYMQNQNADVIMNTFEKYFEAYSRFDKNQEMTKQIKTLLNLTNNVNANQNMGKAMSELMKQSFYAWKSLGPLQRIELINSYKRWLQQLFYSDYLVKRWNKPITPTKVYNRVKECLHESKVKKKKIKLNCIIS